MAKKGPLELPEQLRPVRAAITAALARPVPGNFPEDRRYVPADQPQALGDALVEAIHTELTNARIAYLFKQSMTRRGQVTWAKASKASAKLELLGCVDFVVDVNWEQWKQLPPTARIALIDHELCHFGRDPEDESWRMIPHDLEEFGAIVRRWGLWRDDVVAFKHVFAQLEMFGPGKDMRGVQQAMDDLRDTVPEHGSVTIAGAGASVRLER